MTTPITPEQPARPLEAPHRRPRRWWKGLIIGLLILANAAVGFVLVTVRSAQTAFVENANQLTDVVPELVERSSEASEPVTFLMIGSDTREGLDSLQNFGESAGARGDVIMLLKVYPETGNAQILSLPRDLLVEIPGHGPDRLNAAYAYGGAPLMVRTVRQVTGLPINHYVEIDFVGFQALVDELGGVYLDFPHPARDRNSGLSVEAGNQLLSGDQALAFARSRHYEELHDGDWEPIKADDFGRTERQQELILAILSRLKRPSSLTEAGAIVASFAQHLTVDSALAQSSLVQLAFNMRGLNGSTMQTATLPGFIDNYEDMSIVRMEHPEGDDLIVAFANGHSLNSEVVNLRRLEVLNGSGVSGSAGRMSDLLEGQGFEIASVGDADRSDFKTTTVIVRPEALDQGRRLIDAIGFGEVSTGSIGDGIDAIIIVGLDADRAIATG